jgi:3',5'-cyclic AMP phosphodiesterase CpdA
VLKPFQSFRRDNALNFWAGAKAEPEKLPFLRSRHCTLRFVYLELEFVGDEARDALHHPLTSPLAAHVDVAIIRVAEVAVATTLELAVEFVEHEVGQQG